MSGVSAQVGDKPGCTGTGDGKRLKSSYGLCSAHQLRGMQKQFLCPQLYWFGPVRPTSVCPSVRRCVTLALGQEPLEIGS